MFTTILKSNSIVSFGLSYLLGIVVLAYGVYGMSVNPMNTDLLYSHWAFSWLELNGGLLPYLSVFIVLVLAIISRLRIRETKRIFGNRNLAMLALVCLIMVQSGTLAKPDILAATLLSSAAFMLLFSTYKQEAVLSELFHVSLLIGIASILVGQCIFLMAVVLFSVLILRTAKAKEWIIIALGLAMTAVFVSMVTIWSESFLLAFQRVVQSSWSGTMGPASLNLGHILMFPAILAGLAGMFGSITTGTIAERNLALANSGWLVGVVFLVLILGLGWQNGIILAAFPLSVYTAKALEEIKRWWMADMLLVTLIAAPFLSSLWQL